MVIISINHINHNTAEYKFFQSSIQLWTNTIQNLIWNIGWAFSDDMQKEYINKRISMVKQLTELSTTINNCKFQNIDNYQKLSYKVNSFKQSLLNTNFITLDTFIKNYDQYSLYLYSLKKIVNRTCKNLQNK